jgi:hypothetical protein
MGKEVLSPHLRIGVRPKLSNPPKLTVWASEPQVPFLFLNKPTHLRPTNIHGVDSEGWTPGELVT